MGEAAPACLILLVSLTMVSSEGTGVQFSFADSTILLPPQINTKHCRTTGNDDDTSCYQCFHNHTNKGFGFNQTNNSTGDVIVTIPLYPSSDTNVTYLVKLDVCNINATDEACYNETNASEEHQNLNFFSTGVNCTNKTTMYVDVKLSNLWSQKYRLSVKPNCPGHNLYGKYFFPYRKYVFNVTNNFTKPKPFLGQNRLAMNIGNVDKRLIVNVSSENLTPPVRQMTLFFQRNTSSGTCGPKINRLVTVYINLSPQNSSQGSVWQNYSNSSQQQVLCTPQKKENIQVECYFKNFTNLEPYESLKVGVLLDKDFRCQNIFEDLIEGPNGTVLPNLYNNTKETCCFYKNYSTPAPSNPPSNPEGTSDLQLLHFILGILFFLLVAVLSVIIGSYWKLFKSQNMKLRPMYEIVDIPNTEIVQPKVLLMYPLESNKFQAVTAQLKNKLSYFCDVIDYCDPRHEDVEANSWMWAQNQLLDTNLSVVLVVTSCSLDLVNNHLRYQKPSALTNVYTFIYDKIQKNHYYAGMPIFVVRFEESLDTSMVLSYRTYLLPKQLPMLVKSLLNNTDLDVPPDSELDNRIADYNRYILEQPEYQQSIFIFDESPLQLY